MALSQNVQDLSNAVNGVTAAITNAVAKIDLIIARLPNPEDAAAITGFRNTLVDATNALNAEINTIPPAP